MPETVVFMYLARQSTLDIDIHIFEMWVLKNAASYVLLQDATLS